MNLDNKRSLGKLRIAARQLNKEKDYWVNRLQSSSDKVSFPFDSYNSEGINYDTLSTTFSNELSGELIRISKGSEYGLHTILMFSVQALIHKYTEAKDICIGTSVYAQKNRNEDVLNKYLSVRSLVPDGLVIKKWLEDYTSEYKQDIAHQNYPFEVLMETLGQSFDQNSNPWFDVSVFLLNVQDESLVEAFGPSIAFIFKKDHDTISLKVKFNSNRYNTSSIEGIVNSYCAFLQNVLRSLDKTVDEVSMLPEVLAGTDLCLVGEKLEINESVITLFEQQALLSPKKTAVVDNTTSLTYTELLNRVNLLASELKKKGLGSNPMIGVMLNSSIDLIVAILGCLKAGAAYIPIDIDYPANRKKFIIENSSLSFLITNSATCDTQSSLIESLPSESLINLDKLTGEVENFSVSINPKDNAYVIYTSGTTGNPKGVVINHQNLANYILWAAHQYVDDKDVFPLFTSVSFDLTITSIFVPLITGNTIQIYSFTRGDQALQEIAKDNKVTVVKLTPSHLKIINAMDDELFKNSKIRAFIVGGEQLDTSLAKAIVKKFSGRVKIFNEYGPTEATVGCMIHEFNSEKDTKIAVPIGIPSANNSLYILDKKLKFIPKGVIGELYICGESLSKGYLGNKELTAEKFIDNPYVKGEKLYKTGDLAKALPTGLLEFIGRKDNQVKIQGYRIELDGIQSRILEIEGIKDALVVVKNNDQINSKSLWAYYVANEALAPSVLKAKLEESLPGYMVPVQLIQLESIPLTEHGKINFSALPESISSATEESASPSTPLEILLVETLQSVLKVEKIRLEDNIFSLGTDSIRTIQLAAYLHKKINIRIEVSVFYDYPVVRDLAAHIQGLAKQKEEKDFVVQQTNEVLAELDNFKARNKQIVEEKVDWEGVEEIFPMSEIEKAMLYYSAVFKESPLYLEQNLYNVNYVNFDFDKFKQAVFYLIHKHSTLRSGFDINESIHIIYKTHNPTIAYYDIATLDENEQQKYIDEIRVKDRNLPKNFLNPTLKFSFFKVQEDQFILMLEFHHAVMDGWSLHSFLVELNNTYVEIVKNGEMKPSPLKCNYEENIVEELLNKKSVGLTEYWKSELQDYKRFVFPTLNGSLENEKKDAVLLYETRGVDYIEKLQNYCNANEITLKSLCFAAYIYTLNVISYENDIVVGQVTNTRPLCEDGEKLLGCFLNTVPVRIKVKPMQKAMDFIKSMHNKLSEQKKFENISLLEIKDRVGEKSTDQNPFFDTKYNFIDFHVIHDLKKYEIERKAGRSFNLSNFTIENTNCDFCIDLTGGWRFFASWVYSPDYINSETVQTLLTTFMNVLDFFVDSPLAIIEKSNFLPEGQKLKVTEEFNGTDVNLSSEKGILQLFEEQVLKTPDNIAVQTEDEYLTFHELNSKANQLAQTLINKGVKKGDIVPILVERSSEMVVGIYAIWKAQAAYLPISIDYPANRINFLIEDSGAKVLLTKSSIKFKETTVFPLYLDTAENYQHKPNNLDLGYDSAQLAYVIYTSGSTGSPKGVMIEHQAVLNRLNWMQNKYSISTVDSILQKTPYFFDVSVWELFWGSFTGAKLCLLKPGHEKEPREILKAIETYGITTLHFVPSMFSAFVNYIIETNSAEKLSSLKQIFLSGEALKPAHVVRFNKFINNLHSIDLINLYGPTEATVDVTYYDCPKKENIKVIPIGKPIDNTSMYILDRNLEPQPVGVIGELYIAGHGLARGYLNKKELTQERFVKKPGKSNELMYRSGDLARWLPDGNIEYCGRIDAQVKIRGFRIELGEVEYQLSQIAGIKEVSVLAKVVGDNKCLCAYYVSSQDYSSTDLREKLLDNLPDYMVPQYFISLEIMPLTPNGKIDTRMLLQIDNQIPEHTFTSPTTEVEQKLVEIFAEGLNISADAICIETSFFEMGANSINMLKINLKINKEYSKEIPVATLFRLSTIKSLAGYINEEAFTNSNIELQLEESLQVMDETMELILNDEGNN